jgi:hypothetical protein
MKIIVKRKIKLMIMKKLINKNFCFLIITGKQKILSELFGKNSVLHISLFKNLINTNYILSYPFSYVCTFKFKDFAKNLELYYDRRFNVHQICVNNSFINFYKLYDYDKYIYLKKISILNIFLINIYLLVYMILNILLLLIDVLYFILKKQC